MTTNQSPRIIPLNSDLHRGLKVRELGSFGHVKSAHMVPVTVHEFSRIGSEFPVVFVKNSETGQFQAVALFGLKVGENLFLDGDSWRGVQVPGCIRNHPFVLAPSGGNQDQLMVALNESSPLVSEEEGLPLFTETGEESDYLKAKKQSLVDYLDQDRMTRAFVAELADKELLTPQAVTVNAGSETLNLQGIYIIDEQKFNGLDEGTFSDMRKRGFLGPVYAQLMSLHQFSRLAKLQSDV